MLGAATGDRKHRSNDKAFEEILRESSRKPWELDTDGCVEFTGGAFEPFLESKEI